MGQMANALLLGVNVKRPKKLGDDGWNEVIGKFRGGEKPETPWGERCKGTFFGYYIACGGSDDPNVPELDEPLPLSELPDAWPAKYKKRYLKASAAWATFSKWAKEQGYDLPPPRLYLVQTEVA